MNKGNSILRIKLLKDSVELTNEIYLKEDINKNYHVFLSELEFNLLRIHRYIFTFLKENFSSNKIYSIPENSFSFTLFKTKSINFKTSSIYKYDILFQHTYYTFRRKGRCITFNYKDGQSIRFIPDETYLKSVLNEYKITSFYVSMNENSNISIDDALSVFLDEEIIELFDKSKKKVLSEYNFNKRFNDNIINIKDISLNAKIYFEDSYNNTFKKDIYDEVFENLINFFSSSERILYLFGPRKSGKSVFLNFLPNFLALREYASLYFNIDFLAKTKTIKDIKYIIYHELLYTIKNKNEIEDLYNLKLFKDIKYNNKPLDFLNSFISNFIEKYDDIKFSAKLIIIIIDNLYIFNDSLKNNILKHIIEIINKKDKFKVILSGEGDFLTEKIKMFYAHKNKYNENYLLMNHINNKVIKFNKNKDKEDLINDELSYLKKFNIINLIYCNNLDGKTLNFQQVEKLNIIKILPNYLSFEFLEDKNEIKFEIKDKLFKEALDKEISFDIQKEQLQSIMSRNYFPRNVYGISEELLIILLLKYNKFKINSLFFKEENIIEVDEINKLKSNYSLDKFKGKIIKEDNFDLPKKLLFNSFIQIFLI